MQFYFVLKIQIINCGLKFIYFVLKFSVVVCCTFKYIMWHFVTIFGFMALCNVERAGSAYFCQLPDSYNKYAAT